MIQASVEFMSVLEGETSQCGERQMCYRDWKLKHASQGATYLGVFLTVSSIWNYILNTYSEIFT